MQIFSGISDFKIEAPTAAAIGKFDGVHLGHKVLIEDIIAVSKLNGYKSVIFTFSPSPESFFCGRALKELTTTAEKRKIFESMGIDILIEFPMNKETAATDPELFISKYLCEQMNVKYISAGADISFGDKGKGNADLLKQCEKQYGYECHIVDKVMYHDENISSTLVRSVVSEGRMEEATLLLGNPYKITGVVVHGKALGRTLNMPTANVNVASDKLIGPTGVYFTMVHTPYGDFPGTSNVGVKPTVSNEGYVSIETYLYNFNEDLYGKYIEVDLLKFSRPEMKFSSVEELKNQMEKDLENGRSFHGIK